MTDYLTVAEVLAMHADQIERYGDSPGVRDQGLLEAAPYRPQTGYYADLIEEAVALWESLAQNHSFVDGNKRRPFAATYTFLAINGLYLTLSAHVEKRK
jgi:death-on-curing protein